MHNVFIVVYCNGDMIPSSKGIVFECPSGPKAMTISKDMSLDVLRKTIFYTNRGCKIILDLFYCQPFHVGDDCVEYDCMKFKRIDDVRKIFFHLFRI